MNCTDEHVDAILGFLGDGSVDGAAPFLAVACRRAGIDVNTMKNWIRAARRDAANDPAARLAREADRVRSEYIAGATALIGRAGTREEDVRARNLQWNITRLDRETFDTGLQFRQRVNAPPGESDRPKHKQADVATIAAALEKGEDSSDVTLQ